MTLKYNIVQTTSPSKEEFRIYTEPRFKSFHTTSIKRKNNLEVSRQRSNIRAKRRLIELLQINFPNDFAFITLTFKDNVNDLSVTNRIFSTFIRRLKYFLKKKNINFFKYICVVETQKRGAIHYHIVCNLPKFTSYSELIRMWEKSILKSPDINMPGGSVYVRYSDDFLYNNIENLSTYLGKYMLKYNSKELSTFLGKKIFFTSKNLKKPIRNDYYHPLKKNLSHTEIQKEIESLFESELQNKSFFTSSFYYDKYTQTEVILLEYKK